MRFRLVYEGRLGGQNTKEADKQQIRSSFHDQLESLWQRPPLANYQMYRVRQGEALPSGMRTGLGFLYECGGLVFCPLVNERWRLLASIDALILTKKHYRKVFGHPEDIDNRLKLLVDALRMPTEGEIRKGMLSWGGPSEMNCLLEDDALVDRLSVQTDYLHRAADPGDVLAVIEVNTRADQLTMENSALAA